LLVVLVLVFLSSASFGQIPDSGRQDGQADDGSPIIIYGKLLRAFNAALSTIRFNGDYHDWAESVGGNLIIPGDCAAFPGAFPWPEINELDGRGIFERIISGDRDLLLVDVGGSNYDTNSFYLVLYDLLINAINDHYQTTITTRISFYNSSLEALRALQRGDADAGVPNFSAGGFVAGLRRNINLPSSCHLFASVPSVSSVVATVTSESDLRAATGLRICIAGAGTFQQFVASFPQHQIFLRDNLDCGTGLTDGTFDIAGGSFDGATVFTVNIASPVAMYFQGRGLSLLEGLD